MGAKYTPPPPASQPTAADLERSRRAAFANMGAKYTPPSPAGQPGAAEAAADATNTAVESGAHEEPKASTAGN